VCARLERARAVRVPDVHKMQEGLSDFRGAMMKTCATCRHAKGILCGRITKRADSKARLIIHFEDSQSARPYVQIDDDFGCVLHEEKEG